MHVVIVGGGAALAQPLIDHWLSGFDDGGSLPFATIISAVCRRSKPKEEFANLHVYDSMADPSIIGPIDVLIIMPADFDNAPLEGMTDKQWDRVLESTLTVPFKALRTFLPWMQEESNVVVVGSIAGKLGGRGCANYAAAKAGLVGLVAAAANESWDRGICINLLESGYMDVGMGAQLSEKVRDSTKLAIPLGRFGTVEDFVLAVEFLAKTRYMTGNVLTLAGGLR